MGSATDFKRRCNQPDACDYFVKFVGGTTAVTKVAGTGKGVTVTYISTGVVDLTFELGCGKFLGLAGAPAFEATTQSGVKGYTAVAGVFNTTTRTLRLNICNAAESLTDLAALQWLSVTACFSESSAS